MQHKIAGLTGLPVGGVVVTANDRLSRQLRLQHARESEAAGYQVWERPAIMSWSAWLRECHDALLDQAIDAGTAPPPVLSQQQAEAVWQQIIEQSDAGTGLLQASATAAAAYEAWDRLCGWQVPSSVFDRHDHTDVQAFADWLKAYQSRSREEGWLDPARLADHIVTAFRDGSLPVPPCIYYAGFDEPRPQQQTLFDALADLGSEIRELPKPEHPQAQCRQWPCTDSDAEIAAAARWAREQLEADPAQSIGIVIHDLASQRETVARVFDEVLCPALRLSDADGTRPYNISLGRPLSDAPLVRDALLVLELAAGPVSWTTVSALLRSPFFAGAEAEKDNRARLDARLRQRGGEQVSLRDLQFHARDAGCPVLLKAIEQCRSLLEQTGGRQSTATHASSISEWLVALGWSKGRALSSAEYQTVNAWWELLGEFAQLDAYVGRINWQQAVSRLQRQAGNKLFQPQSVTAPVQIMGLLEATGLEFDRLWIMGLYDDVWPASPRPHPLLPIPLQRQYGMPHATAERELEYARRATARLLTSAPEVIASWPQQSGDAELRASPLLAHLPMDGGDGQSEAALMHRLFNGSTSLEAYDDTPPPAWQADETLRGGTGVLKNQAACPFRAFAEHRLHARQLEEPLPGLDAAGRGALVHEVMRVIWSELGDQAALLELDAQAQIELVGRCVEQALSEWETKNASSLPPRFRQVEASRLNYLANDWLRLDRERTPFSVQGRETEQQIEIEGLPLKGRIDRLDRLEDDTRLIIDYKTGKVDRRVWLDERPDDPQLPLYALGQRDHIGGIAFAQLRIGDLQYAGIADRDDVAEGIEAVADWKYVPSDCGSLNDLLAYWQTNLNAVARSFRNGDSQVDPKDPRRTCTYCPQYTLCRINEITLGGHDLEADND